MLAGVVVAEFGGLRQPFQHFDLRSDKGARAFLDPLFEAAVGVLLLHMKQTSRQQVANAKQDFGLVERLGQKVLRSLRQRRAPRRGRSIGGQHHHRQKLARLQGRAQSLQHVQPADVRHHPIK